MSGGPVCIYPQCLHRETVLFAVSISDIYMVVIASNICSLSMIYAGFKCVGTWWNYKNVISPFYRLYYIADGYGRVYLDNKCYELVPDSLFLIPKFTYHSYACDDFMEHYYICFFDDLTGSAGILNPKRMNLQVEARTTDLDLMKRYLDLNPHHSLVVSDPKRYDNSRKIYQPHEENVSSSMAGQMESNGILWQLFSRFVTEESVRMVSST